MIVICDRCKKEFKIKLKRRIKGEIEVSFFKCSKCRKEYPVTYDNEITKSLRQRIETIDNYLFHNPNEEIRQKKEQEKRMLTIMLKQEEHKIKESVEGE